MTEPLAAVDLTGVSVRFGAVQALLDVDLTVRHGEVHALLGENGCGKSSLVKVLAGINIPEQGAALAVSGEPVALPLLPGQFRGLGMSFVHQDLGLVRTLTVLENLLVGDDLHSRWSINWAAERRRAQQVLDSYGVRVDPSAVIDRLPPVEQALVAIVRAAEELRRHREAGGRASVMFLDEPTVFLPEEQVEFLFDLIRTVVAEGSGVVFISHDLAAVRAVADRATVLRDGQVAGHVEMGSVSDRDLVDLIVGQGAGRKLVDNTYRTGTPAPADTPRVEITGLRGGAVQELGVPLRPGEIVGLAGLLGSGAEEVPYLVFGARPATAGTLRLGDAVIDLASFDPATAIDSGVALVPAERRRDGIATELDVSQNLMVLVGSRYFRGGRLRLRKIREAVRDRLDRFDVRPRNPNAAMRTLSGGNQQKVVLAKWLEIEPRLLLLHEPTQGVDIAARAEIYRLARDATERGTAVLWCSSDNDELATVCDRVHVMADGRAVAELSGDEISGERISAAVYEASAGSTGSSAA